MRNERTRVAGSGNEDLTTAERAAMIALLASGQELTNTELRERAGFTLSGEPRRRLNERKLVASRKVGRAFAHEITDDGAAWCRDELGASRPSRAGYLGGALYLVLEGLSRSGIPLDELFPVPLAARIRQAYQATAGDVGEFVTLAALRARLDTVPRADLDAELARLASTPGVHLQAEPDQGAVTAAERDAAVRIGGEDRHMIMIEAG
jgi:hypothetical protein